MTIALGITVMAPGEEQIARPFEVMASQLPRPDEMSAYERVLGDAMAGDATIFARQDYVEEAWRIVDPILHVASPGRSVSTRTRGDPTRSIGTLAPQSGGWQNPTEPA